MCEIDDVGRVFDKWLMPLKFLEVGPLIFCVSGCDTFCTDRASHLDHEIRVVVDLPRCFVGCTTKLACDCWWAVWEDLGWFGTRGESVASELGADYIVEYNLNPLGETGDFEITYWPSDCPAKMEADLLQIAV